MAKAGKKVAVGTLVGVAAGFVAGILTAPKSGKETRKDLKDTTTKIFRDAEKNLKQLHGELGEVIDKASNLAKKTGFKAERGFKTAQSKAAIAQQRVKEVISALRNGETDEPELQQALKDASAAIDNLKKYLKKTNNATK